jgi:Putative bacterial sensory transduction regulator
LGKVNHISSQLFHPIQIISTAMSNFSKVKNYLLDLGYTISKEDEQEELFIVNAEEKGIVNMIVDCEGDVLVIEQHIFDCPADNVETFKRLLQINRSVIHGAYVLDAEGKKVIFRDTLQLPTLDSNELEGSINALSFSLAENAGNFIGFANN